MLAVLSSKTKNVVPTKGNFASPAFRNSDVSIRPVLYFLQHDFYLMLAVHKIPLNCHSIK